MTNSTTAERTVKLERLPSEGRAGKIRITADGKVTTYLLSPVKSEMGGRGFHLKKLEVVTTEDGRQTDVRVCEAYNTLLNGKKSTCDCKWGTFGVNKKFCRHVASLTKLVAEGKLS